MIRVFCYKKRPRSLYYVTMTRRQRVQDFPTSSSTAVLTCHITSVWPHDKQYKTSLLPAVTAVLTRHITSLWPYCKGYKTSILPAVTAVLTRHITSLWQYCRRGETWLLPVAYSDTYVMLTSLLTADASQARRVMTRSSSRPGQPTTSNSCGSVRGVPGELRSANVMKPSGLSSFYQKYTEAYGIPVLGKCIKHLPNFGKCVKQLPNFGKCIKQLPSLGKCIKQLPNFGKCIKHLPNFGKCTKPRSVYQAFGKYIKYW